MNSITTKITSKASKAQTRGIKVTIANYLINFLQNLHAFILIAPVINLFSIFDRSFVYFMMIQLQVILNHMPEMICQWSNLLMPTVSSYLSFRFLYWLICIIFYLWFSNYLYTYMYTCLLFLLFTHLYLYISFIYY